jgi:hypothetical protein
MRRHLCWHILGYHWRRTALFVFSRWDDEMGYVQRWEAADFCAKKKEGGGGYLDFRRAANCNYSTLYSKMMGVGCMYIEMHGWKGKTPQGM